MTAPGPAETTRPGGFGAIAVSTVLAGLMGYAITTIAARGLGPEAYADFSSFWGMQYLLVGALGGLQQEYSRATSPASAGPGEGARVTSRFALIAASIAGASSVLVVLTAGPAVFEAPVPAYVPPLLVGIAVYAVIAIYTGVMYGVSAWRTLMIVIILDPLLRLAGIGIVILIGGGVLAAVWASVVPYVVVAVVLLGASAFGESRGFRLDVGPSQLAINALRTVGAAVGVSVLVSGLPLLVGLARGDARPAEVGTLVFVLILTRAPLVLAVLSLQSYLIVHLRGRGIRPALVLLAVVVAAGALLTLAGYFWGAPVIEAIAGARYAVDPRLVAVLVASSVTTALLGVTGAAVLARGRHGWYVAGWSVAALLTVVLMLIGSSALETRVAVALIAGPLVGLLLHALALARLRGNAPASGSL